MWSLNKRRQKTVYTVSPTVQTAEITKIANWAGGQGGGEGGNRQGTKKEERGTWTLYKISRLKILVSRMELHQLASQKEVWLHPGLMTSKGKGGTS